MVVYDIKWDTDEEKEWENLQSRVNLTEKIGMDEYIGDDGSLQGAALAEDVSDILSEMYGFCITEFNILLNVIGKVELDENLTSVKLSIQR